MSNKITTAIPYAALLYTVLFLLGCCAAFSIDAEDAIAEAQMLRAETQELSEHNEYLREKLVSLSGEYHRLYDETHTEQTAWYDAGEFTITHYCGCPECCGKNDGITATGTVATMGRTVSVDASVIPLGSEVLINGQVYFAEDTGVHGKHIDIYIESHEQARQMGVYKTEVAYR